jgi:N-acetylmuramoyl-L-alanine amidase
MRRVKLFSALLIMILTFTFALPEVTTKADLSAVVIVELLNIRKAPRLSYPVISQAARGTVLTLIGRTIGGTWVEVSGSFGRGWVSSQLIVVRGGGEIGTLPITDSSISPFVTIVAYPAVTVRSGPSVSFPAIGYLRTGAVVDIIGQDPKSKWLEVLTPFGSGWIQTQYTNVTGDIFAAPNTDDLATPVIKNVNYRTNVRSAPSTAASVVYTLGYEEYAFISGISADGKWWRIYGKWGSGWVSAKLVLAIGNLNRVPVAN